jgi:hypothetical protein
MMGLIRRQGDTLQILYRANATARPASFENPPMGFYLMTLKREK